MKSLSGCMIGWKRVIFTMFVGALLLGGAGATQAVEVGHPAPHFNLPATTGTNISLRDYRGKSWVLIEFYGADFAPT